MSDEIVVEPKKKGKLPVIIALVALLVGGGFFGLKARQGGKKKEPAVKLGVVEPLKEFLVNLRDGHTYLRTEVALQFADTFKKEDLEHNLPAITDAILLKLSSKALSEVNTLAGKEALKREIAGAINLVLENNEKDKAEPKKTEAIGKHPGLPQKLKDTSILHPDWDSEKGPVLKVFFTSFATQSS